MTTPVTTKADDQLRCLVEAGHLTVSEIAVVMDKKRETIQRRMKALGLELPPKITVPADLTPADLSRWYLRKRLLELLLESEGTNA